MLHLHVSLRSEPVGPEYSYPEGRTGTANAARDEKAMLVHARRTLTPLETCGLQVCGDFTRILRDRVICLERQSRQLSTVGRKSDVVVSYPVKCCDIARRVGYLGNRKDGEEEYGGECDGG